MVETWLNYGATRVLLRWRERASPSCLQAQAAWGRHTLAFLPPGKTLWFCPVTMLVPDKTNRRNFLKRAALAAGTMQALHGTYLFADAAPGAKLRTAVIGCGGRGEVSLDGALTENLVAIVDVDDKRLAAAAKKASSQGAQPRTFSDYRRMFDTMH